MTDNSNACILFVTTNQKANAESIISALLQKKLAACIQTLPVESHYTWKDSICMDQEILLLIKTLTGHTQSIEKEILKIHPYDVPQIIQVPVTDGLPAYLQWLTSSVLPVKNENQSNPN